LLHQKTLPELAPGAHTDALFVWEAPGTGAYELAADLMMPSGISDPVEENNRIGRQIVIASTYRYLPVINGPQFQSGATAGVQCSNKLLNSGFEAGTLANWSVSPFVGLMNAGCLAGSYCAWLGRGWNIEDDLYQTVSIKPWASAHLTYGWAVVTAERAAEQRDTLTVEVRSAEGQLLRTIETLGNQDAHPYWYTSSFDLSEFVGQTVQIRFHAHNDGADVTNFFLDEIILEVCERSQ
jgi:hypothetical protein